MPLHFRPNNDSDLCDIETANQLPSNTILRAHWIKPTYWRAPDQTCSHVLAVMTRPEDTNTILTNSLVICQKRVYAEKCKKEPNRCLKCHGWGHMSYDCQQPFSVCGTCAGRHRIPNCNNCDRTRCVSCGVEGHASWDRRCPAFLSKCHEMDARMTKNQMPHYPTGDPWTHALRLPKPAPPMPKPIQPQPQQCAQPGGTGANQTATSGQRRAYQQATLSFPPSQTIPRLSDGPDTVPQHPAHDEQLARDANGVPTGHAKPWGDGMENENEGASLPYPI